MTQATQDKVLTKLAWSLCAIAVGLSTWATTTAYSQGTDISNLKANQLRDIEFRHEVIRRLDRIEDKVDKVKSK